MFDGVSIAIPTHNRERYLDQTLASFGALRAPGGLRVEVMVIENGCTDGTSRVVKSWIERFKFPLRLVHEEKLGLNHARNRAAAEAKYELVSFLDDDVMLEEDWLAGMLESYASCDGDIIGGRVHLVYEGGSPPAWMHPDLEIFLSRLDWGDEIVHNPAWCVGANFTFKKKVWEKTGEFRPELDRKGKKLISHGETEWSERAKRAGFKLYYSPKFRLRHYIPLDRMQMDYFLRLIQHKAISDLLVTPTKRPYKTLWASIKGMRKHTVGAWRAALGGRKHEQVLERMKVASNLGLMKGVLFYRNAVAR